MFNWLTMITLFPIEILFHYLERVTEQFISMVNLKQDKNLKVDFLKKLTKPTTRLIVHVIK